MGELSPPHRSQTPDPPVKHFPTRLAIIPVALACVQFAFAGTLILTPPADSTVRLNTTNQGTSAILFVGDTLPNANNTECFPAIEWFPNGWQRNRLMEKNLR